MSMNEFHFNETPTHATLAQYPTDTVTFFVNNVNEFVKWFNETACSHASWTYKKMHRNKKKGIPGADEYNRTNHCTIAHIKCCLSGFPPVRDERQPKKGNRRSKKVNCKAAITAFFMLDGRIKVIYEWKHQNHDPVSEKAKKEKRRQRSLARQTATKLH
ncbi:hypothetical protein BDF20DRAFT_908998 [Mycotypha africana]|uniref:uncharacterized protein n=1 Tax=Mycotypha africana TaxID=64632 RepID=UPI002300577B|nr:uncharacterized protein BDF20DRAFT_908998 [Mycotypha africana]KAI8991180.1 hypothetical protein BDF20DRAFT_908998 [Mycotypha africana]